MTKKEIEQQLEQYREALKAMDADKWLGHYAEDATVEDPVGGPVFAGRDQLQKFFTGVQKNFKQLHIKPELTVILPPETAIKGSVTGITVKDVEVSFTLIATYKFRDDGRIVQMRAFWDPEELGKQLKS